MSGRKRKSVPARLDQTKQQRLGWNLSDMMAAPSGSSATGPHVVGDMNLPAFPGWNRGKKQQIEDAIHLAEDVRMNELEETKKRDDAINKCDFFFEIVHSMPLSDSEWHCHLGTFTVTIPQPNSGSHRNLPALLPEEELWFYVNTDTPNEHLLYYETEKGSTENLVNLGSIWVMYFQASCDIDCRSLEAISSCGKTLFLKLNKYDPQSGSLEIHIMATEGALVQLQFSSDSPRPRQVHTALQHVLARRLNFPIQVYDKQRSTMKHDISEFYKAVRARNQQENITVDVIVQHCNLRPRLRQYQKEAVKWMLHRERMNEEQKLDTNGVHHLYTEIRMLDGQTLYFNKETGFLVKKKPAIVRSPPGGILADEMGLGKTVEVLACMMCHPRLNLPPIDPLPVITPQPEVPETSGSQIEAFRSEDMESRDSWKVGTCGTQGNGECQMNELNDVTANTTVTKRDDNTLCPRSTNDNFCVDKSEVLEDTKDNLPTLEKLIALDHDYTKESKLTTGEKEQTTDDSKPGPEETGPSSKRKEKKQTKGKASGRLRAKNNVKNQNASKTLDRDLQSNGSKPTCRTKGRKSLECQEAKEAPMKQLSESQVQVSGININDTESAPSEVKEEPPSSGVTEGGAAGEPVLDKPKAKKKRRRIGYVEIVEEVKEEKSMLVKQQKAFECMCGSRKQETDGMGGELRVDCIKCGLKQHAACMKYDLTNPYRGEYMCPHCHVDSPPKPSGATLIISPRSISHQWVEEIHKHIHKEKLRVFVYEGVHKHGYIQPQFLASHDIVITTYEMLQKEINYVDLPHSNSEAGRRFRNPKRFMAVPSPIIAVEWWRICLDEAQMVECTTTKSAEMALRLSAVNRWCVTGTPIQKGLDDLYGLLLFLGEDPYWVQPWWQRLLYQPYCHGNQEPMHDAMSKVLWRTSKSDVLDQICLPMQSEEIHWLNFSPVEDHFYKRTFSICARTGLGSLNKWPDGSTKLNSLDRYTLHGLLGPLARLRQACCHPQAVRGSFLPIQKSMMTMEEVLVSMTKKARQECEEAHRQLVAAMNGQAGLHIIKHKYIEAVDLYRDVLRSIEEKKDQFRTDPLQLLHTLHNLQEILSQKIEGVHPTLRDDKLKEEADDLKAKYLLKAASFVTSAQEAWAPLRSSLKDSMKEIRGNEDWWADLLQWVIYIGSDELLVERIRSELLENRQLNQTTLANSFRNIQGLEYILEGELGTLGNAHETLIDRLHELQVKPTPEMISQTVECCLRPENPEKPLKTCLYCKLDELFDIYENKLFSFKDKGVSEVTGLEGESTFQVGTRRQGTWADSETERILKTIISFAKSYGGASPAAENGTKLVDIGSLHLKIFETLKKEFKVVRTVWIELKAQVSAHDELDMATTRLRLRLPDEPVPDPPQPHILEPAEFDAQKMKLQSDIIIAKNLLTRKTGQLVYLKNLAKAQTSMAGEENTELCPICQRQMGKKWAVFTCGHCFCLDCIRLLIDEYSFGGVRARTKCPLCRQPTAHKDINYVSMVGEEHRPDEIKGDHSTKVEGVVRCVSDILRGDPQTKILVFSLWQNVISILEKAFVDNDVRFVSLTSNKFQKNLADFKRLESINVLLLPVQSGANGLNLIEATHLLLVEPILNPSQELQAIGRIHRIGQTRPTFVHRFLVRNTIEERLHHLLAVRGTNMNASNNADDTPFTIGDLRSLFIESREQHPDMDDENVDSASPDHDSLNNSNVSTDSHTETPVNQNESTETPVNQNENTETPVNQNESTETPVSQNESTETPVNQNVSTETPVNQNVNTDNFVETTDVQTRSQEGSSEIPVDHQHHSQPVPEHPTCNQGESAHGEGTHQSSGQNTGGPLEEGTEVTPQPGMSNHGLNAENQG